MVLKAAASVTGSSGGVSMMTMSKRFSSARRVSIIAVDPSSSLGLGGTDSAPTT